MTRSPRIVIDHDKCVGSRICVAFAPRTFGLDEKGQSQIIDANGDTAEDIRAAAEGCPLSAITIEEAKGDEPEERSAR